MSQDAPQEPGPEAPWTSDQAPCVYCGRVIPRDTDRCPHCRTSFSLAVRKASREVIGPWYYLDARNPSGRGVTFDTLVKMVEKGRIQPDSIVRGPTTHQDWMFAAEAPRLAKYLGICPHCFAQAKPEDTYCTRCQLNMNDRLAQPRPGVPDDLIKTPYHAAAHNMEQQLAQEAPPAEAPESEALDAATPPHAEALAAAAAAFTESAAPGRAMPAQPPRKPNILVVLLLTWATLIPLILIGLLTGALFWFLPSGCEDRYAAWQLELLGRDSGTTQPKPPGPPPVDSAWVKDRLAEADRAIAEGNFQQAIAVYEAIINETGDASWRANVRELQSRMEQQKSERLERLREHLVLADQLANAGRFEDALARLRNIGNDDRELLASAVGVDVAKMEKRIRDERDQQTEGQDQQRRKQLIAELDQAQKLQKAGQLADALAQYKAIAEKWTPELVAEYVNLDRVIRKVETELAAAAPSPPPPPPEIKMTDEEAAAVVAKLLQEADNFEKEEKFAEALQKLEAVRNFEPKHRPPDLDERIRQIRAKKEAIEFFGIGG